MAPSEFQRFVDLMRGMGRIFGNELDNLVLDVYWITLRGWSMSEFEAAVAHLMANAKGMPRPGAFTQLRHAGKHTADEAWAVALERCLAWRTPREALDSIDRTASAIGGYRVIALADQETALPHVQRRFLEAYEAIERASEVRAALPDLAPTPALPVPRSNARDGRFTQLTAPARHAGIGGESREHVTGWLKGIR